MPRRLILSPHLLSIGIYRPVVQLLGCFFPCSSTRKAKRLMSVEISVFVADGVAIVREISDQLMTIRVVNKSM